MDKYQVLLLLIYQESHALSKKSLEAMLANERKHIEKFEEVLIEGMKKGVFKRMNSRMLANFIKILADCWVVKRWDIREKLKLKECKAGILEMVLNGIFIHPKSQFGICVLWEVCYARSCSHWRWNYGVRKFA